MNQVFFLLLVLGFTQSWCCSSGITPVLQKTTGYIINYAPESLQDNAIFDDEDFSPDLDIFCQVENFGFLFPFIDTSAYCGIKNIIYIRNLILVFISDIPPPF
jgi:hypothetical protein